MNDSTSQATRQQDIFKIIPVIYGALLSGVLMFAVISLVVSRGKMTAAIGDNQVMLLVALLFSLGTIVTSLVIHRPMVKAARAYEDPAKREGAYQVICLMRWALMEGATLFCLVMFFVHRNMLFLGLAALPMAVFLALYPSRARYEAMFAESRYVRDATHGG